MTSPIALSQKDANVRILAAAATAAQVELDKCKAENSQLTKLKVTTETHTYNPRPPGFHKVMEAIMERLTWRGWADKTQAEILESIKPNFSAHNLQPSIWNKPLTKKQCYRMETWLSGNNLEQVDVKGCKTFAHFKERIKAHTHSNEAIFTFKGSIAFDRETVTVGKKTYQIEVRKHRSIRVKIGKKRVWIRVDSLVTLLK